MLNFKTYYEDNSKINQNHSYINHLNDAYLNKLWNLIYLKYKNVNNPKEEFKMDIKERSGVSICPPW